MGERTPRIRIMLWTHHARENIAARISGILPPEAALHLVGIGSIVDELAKNAIKANHKFLILRRKIREWFLSHGHGPDEAEMLRDQTCEEVVVLNDFVQAHPEVLEGALLELRTILNQEAVWLEIKNKLRREKRRQMTREERTKLAGTKAFRANFQEIRRKRVYVEFRAAVTGGQLVIEIINAAPILQRDLERIYDKRAEFGKFRKLGTEWEFFMNNMDTSDGGSGLGYATIDSILSQMGFDPEKSIMILSLHNTNVILNLDMVVLSGGGAAVGAG
ncbi:MAG: hypothetical protein HY042_12195 [Spirochaetia bacterium]|nr:hypothetical protein [Spirochaetia bacterium]